MANKEDIYETVDSLIGVGMDVVILGFVWVFFTIGLPMILFSIFDPTW